MAGLTHRAEALAATLPPLLVAAERVAATISQGVHGRRRTGQGGTFWQFRRYQPGDPVQWIDWRQSAKTQPTYIRQTEWEAAQSVWLWRDATPSMHYRSRPSLPTKAERADLLTLSLAALLIRGGEQVALLGTDLPPGGGRVMLERLAALMAEPGGGDLPPVGPLPRHGRIVVIGDLLAPLPTIAAAVEAFAGQGIEGHLLQILDPAEETLPFSGRVRFEGLEGEESAVINRVETVRDEYRGRMIAQREGLTALTGRFGWTFASHHTDRPPEIALMALYLSLAPMRPGA